MFIWTVRDVMELIGLSLTGALIAAILVTMWVQAWRDKGRRDGR